MRYIYFLIDQLRQFARGLGVATSWGKYVRKFRHLTLIQTLELELVLIALLLMIWSYLLVRFEDISLFNAIYLSVITLAGVWYGDITPQTVEWKIVVMIYAILGMPVFIFTMSVIVSSMMERMKANKKRKQKIKTPVPLSATVWDEDA